MASRMLALIIAGYNEELVIGNTIRSAIKAGMNPKDIYFVDDGSKDASGRVAQNILGKTNVMRIKNGGKGNALAKASKKFALTKRYRWIHIADADGGFDANYFRVFRRELRSRYAAATGYVKSLPGSTIGQYRVMDYTVGMEIVRRFQAAVGVITIIPGPTSCFRADIFEKLKFTNGALAEDFDVTLQIHRNRLGDIQFIDEAVAHTHDPMSFKDFIAQIRRWNRGILQGLWMHRIGTKFDKLDAYLVYQIIMNFAMFFSYGVMLPIMAAQHQNNVEILCAAFLTDVFVTAIVVLLTAIKAKRLDIMAVFPHLYAYRWVSLGIFIWSFVEVMLLGRYRRPQLGSWTPPARQAIKAS